MAKRRQRRARVLGCGVCHSKSPCECCVIEVTRRPHGHSLRIVGDSGVLSTEDTWFYDSRVSLRRSVNIARRHQWLPKRRVKLLGHPARYRYRGTQQMDFARGVADLAAATRDGRSPRLSAEYCLHTNEIVLALDTALRSEARYEMTTTFDPIDPMPWAT